MSAEPLPAREAYRLWAATYEETAMNALDENAVSRFTPKAYSRLLDAACGTGRHVARSRGFGIDLVPEMLARGRGTAAEGRLACADLAALPFGAAAFDLVWCRLALGHVDALGAAYRELARVAQPDAHVVVTDVHPDAARRGLTRTFRDAGGVVHAALHHRHELEDHERVARAAGLALEERLESAIGPEIEAHFRAAGALESYRRQRGLPVLAAFHFRRLV
jgi:malonyl-CoA O-methyltransferase